jgi:uncharacterized protein
MEGALALGQLGRVAEWVADPGAEVRYRIAFSREGRTRQLRVEVAATLAPVCQVCLERFPLPVSGGSALVLVGSDTEAERLTAEIETLVVAPGDLIEIADLVEDELILLMPLIPRHEAGCADLGLVGEGADPAALPE